MRLIIYLVLILFCPSLVKAGIDPYGGVYPNAGTATGHFYVTQVGKRWMLVTPDGNGLWYIGLYNAGKDTSVDDLGSSLKVRIDTKYVNSPYGSDADTVNYGPQYNNRILNWGFTNHVDYFESWVSPWHTDNGWIAKTGSNQQPIKIPATSNLIRCGPDSQDNLNDLIPGGAAAGVKDFYWNINLSTYVGGIRNKPFPDIYDPNFDAYCDARLATAAWATVAASPYLIGFTSDELDFLWGFNMGNDFPAVPASKVSPHLGFIILIAAPTQTTGEGGSPTYTDTEMHSKTALKDFLIARYTTIGALNTAWGSSYSTFEQNGGWGVGDGFLDEDGFNSWINTDWVDMTGMDQDIIDDLDDFLYDFARKYFQVYYDNIQQYYPNKMFLGPTSVGGWGTPPRRQILQAANGLVNFLRVSIIAPSIQGKADFVETHYGNNPIAIGAIRTGNPDSALFAYAPSIEAEWQETSQANKATYYSGFYESAFTYESAGGNNTIMGIMYWELHDNWGEKGNYGLISLTDNPYDGVQSSDVITTDQWGYTTFAEAAGKTYGDLITTVKNVNWSIQKRISFKAKVYPGSTTAIVDFNAYSMPPDESCTSVIKTDPGEVTIDTDTLTTGKSTRQAEHTGLTASTNYTANVTCNSYAYPAVSFSTTAAIGGTTNHTFTTGAPVAAIAALLGDTYQVTCTDTDGGCATFCTQTDNDGACGSGCTLTVELASGRVYSCVSEWLDNPAGTVLATSSAHLRATP